MVLVLSYGQGQQVQIRLEAEALVADCALPHGEPLTNLAEATVRALENPLSFPPLAAAVVPGDRLAIALGSGVPRAATLIAKVVETLTAHGVRPADITILRVAREGAEPDDPRDVLSELPPASRESVRLETHDPAVKDQLAYLAADEQGRPVMLNRRLVDADLVVAIGCLRLEASAEQQALQAGLYPWYADLEAHQRRHAALSSALPRELRRELHEAERVHWLLGLHFVVQVVPAGDSEALHVLAGDPETVLNRGRELCAAAWSCQVPRRAKLVVATIPGDARQQTWENVGRALAAASRAVIDRGTIALCTELASDPGPAIQHATSAEDLTVALRRLKHDRTADVAVARQLAQTLDRVKVYLLSRLSEEVVEDLGLAPVTAAEEIGRLAGKHDSCILLSNAQFALPTAADDSGA